MNAAEVKIYGFIGTASNRFDTNTYINAAEFSEMFTAAVNAEGDEIHLRVHSYGGSIGDGNAIQTMIANCKKTVVGYIDGIAASMGYGILLSCNKIVAASNAMILAHNASGAIEGTPEEIAAYANFLVKARNTVAEKIAAKLGITAEEATTKYLLADNWFSAEEALAVGLIDEIDNVEAENVPTNLSTMSYMEAVNAFNKKAGAVNEETFLVRLEKRITEFMTGKKTTAKNAVELSDNEEWYLSYLITGARTLVDDAETLAKNSSNPELIAKAKAIVSTCSKYVIELTTTLYQEEIPDATSASAVEKINAVMAKVQTKKIGEMKTFLANDITTELGVMQGKVTEATNALNTAKNTITAKDTEIATLQAKLAGKPVDDKRPKGTGAEGGVTVNAFADKVKGFAHNQAADKALGGLGKIVTKNPNNN